MTATDSDNGNWRKRSRGVLTTLVLLLSSHLSAGQTLIAPRVGTLPLVDGMSDDPVWRKAVPVTVNDGASGIPITLRAVHDGNSISLQAGFPDPDESREHKTLLWNRDLMLYEMGPEREDTLVLKWAMTSIPTDLKLTGGIEYRADIWYWKSHRSDPTGHADDKLHIYSAHRAPRSLSVTADNGRLFYITRIPDLGESAYRTLLEADYHGDRLPAYGHQQPSGSRADIRARGHWQDGRWMVEFMRKLDTGHGDDVVFAPGGEYRFAVSRYEIAGRPSNPDQSQPLHGAGEVSEVVVLRLEK